MGLDDRNWFREKRTRLDDDLYYDPKAFRATRPSARQDQPIASDAFSFLLFLVVVFGAGFVAGQYLDILLEKWNGTEAVGSEQAVEFGDAEKQFLYSHYKSVSDAFSVAWHNRNRPVAPQHLSGLKAVVAVKILPTGQITDIVVKESSGVSIIDQAIVATFRDLGRVPAVQDVFRRSPDLYSKWFREQIYYVSL